MALIQFIPPSNNERGPAHLQSLLEGWIALAGKEGIRLGLSSENGELRFLIDFPGRRQRIIASQLENAYPGGKAVVARPKPAKHSKTTRWLRLSPDVWPIKLHSDFVDSDSSANLDPLEGLFEMIKSGRSGRLGVDLWFELKPLKKSQKRRGMRNAKYLGGKFRLKTLEKIFESKYSSSSLKDRFTLSLIRRFAKPQSLLPAEVELKLEQHLFSAAITIEIETDEPSQKLHERRVKYLHASICHLTDLSAVFFVERRNKGSFMLSAPEIATLWHIPTVDSEVPRVEKNTFVELEPPANLPRPSKGSDVVGLGRVCFRNENYRFGMDLEARRRHLWILGKTGMGKTTLLQSIIKQDLEAGRGLAVIEPHGDFAEGSLRYVPKTRKNDLIYFDPADEKCSITFNPLQVPLASDKTLVADGVLTAFQKIFGLDESQAPRLLHIFRNCLLSLVEMPNATLLDVQRILVEPLYRKSVIARVDNSVVRSFWLDEFGKWKPHDRTAFIASLQNKLGAFLSNPKLQRVFSKPKGKLDFRRIMDERQILIINLSKGRLGENASNLLGTLLVTSLQLAAMSRANIPEQQRQDFSIIMDEFQNFTSPSIATFLSEARKYRTHLIVANQFMSQIPEETLRALQGNVGSRIIFRLGDQDAKSLEQSLTSQSVNIPRFHAYCSLESGGSSPRFFSMATVNL